MVTDEIIESLKNAGYPTKLLDDAEFIFDPGELIKLRLTYVFDPEEFKRTLGNG